MNTATAKNRLNPTEPANTVIMKVPPIEIEGSPIEAATCRAQLPGIPKAFYDYEKPADIVDGCTSAKDLSVVVKRTLLVALAFGVASSFFLATAIAALNITQINVGPIGFVIMHVMSIIDFVGIMLPFSVLLAWVSRYDHARPYQRAMVEVQASTDTTFNLCLASLASLRIDKIVDADSEAGFIRAIGSARTKAGAQGITVTVHGISSDRSYVTVESRPVLSAIEALIFGYTLCVDAGQNKRNTDHILQFLRSSAPVSPAQHSY